MKTKTMTMTIKMMIMTMTMTMTTTTTISRRRKPKLSRGWGGAGRGEGARTEGTAQRRPLRLQTSTADNGDNKYGNNKDGLGGGGRTNNRDSYAGGGGGGGDHQTVLLLDSLASPFLCLNQHKIRQAYRFYVVDNCNVLNLEPKSRVFQLF